MSAATSERKVGAAAPPDVGPAKTKFAFSLTSVAVSVPLEVTGEPLTEKIEGIVSATLVTVPRFPFRVVPVKDELFRLQESGGLVWKDVEQLVQGDWLRTIPGVHPCDGFFAAILERWGAGI